MEQRLCGCGCGRYIPHDARPERLYIDERHSNRARKLRQKQRARLVQDMGLAGAGGSPSPSSAGPPPDNHQTLTASVAPRESFAADVVAAVEALLRLPHVVTVTIDVRARSVTAMHCSDVVLDARNIGTSYSIAEVTQCE